MNSLFNSNSILGPVSTNNFGNLSGGGFSSLGRVDASGSLYDIGGRTAGRFDLMGNARDFMGNSLGKINGYDSFQRYQRVDQFARKDDYDYLNRFNYKEPSEKTYPFKNLYNNPIIPEYKPFKPIGYPDYETKSILKNNDYVIPKFLSPTQFETDYSSFSYPKFNLFKQDENEVENRVASLLKTYKL